MQVYDEGPWLPNRAPLEELFDIATQAVLPVYISTSLQNPLAHCSIPSILQTDWGVHS